MKKLLLAAIAAFFMLGASLASAQVVDVVYINGYTTPWSIAANPNDAYAMYRSMGNVPIVVSVAGESSISLSATGYVTESILSYGTYSDISVSGYNNLNEFGNGNSPTSLAGVGPGQGSYFSQAWLPSHFIEPTNTGPDIYLGALIATFADNNGVIVGTPFAPGSSDSSIAVPSGATELLLGVNNDVFEQGGVLVPGGPTWTVTATLTQAGVGGVSGGVPEAPTCLMALAGFLAMAAFGARRSVMHA